jgi:hypothetical protein
VVQDTCKGYSGFFTLAAPMPDTKIIVINVGTFLLIVTLIALLCIMYDYKHNRKVASLIRKIKKKIGM